MVLHLSDLTLTFSMFSLPAIKFSLQSIVALLKPFEGLLVLVDLNLVVFVMVYFAVKLKFFFLHLRDLSITIL